MKVIIILSIILGSQFLSDIEDKNQITESGLVLKADYRGYYNFPPVYLSGKYDSTYYFLFDAKLINNTASLVEFLTFSCTPMHNIVLNSKNYRLCQNNCINNQFFSVKLNPGQEFSIPVIIEAKKKHLGNCFKIGWVFLTKDNTKNVDYYFEVLKRAATKYENVIWSNEVCFDELGGHPIEIR